MAVKEVIIKLFMAAVCAAIWTYMQACKLWHKSVLMQAYYCRSPANRVVYATIEERDITFLMNSYYASDKYLSFSSLYMHAMVAIRSGYMARGDLGKNIRITFVRGGKIYCASFVLDGAEQELYTGQDIVTLDVQSLPGRELIMNLPSPSDRAEPVD